jgi:hypothetical protein
MAGKRPTKDEIIAHLEARLAALEEAFSRMEDWVIDTQDNVLPYVLISESRVRELNFQRIEALAKARAATAAATPNPTAGNPPAPSRT